MVYPHLAFIIFLAFTTIFTGFVVQSFKSDLYKNGQAYDSVVDKLCAQFKQDRDIHLYMQGLTVDHFDNFYFVYRDQLYHWYVGYDGFKDTLWPHRPEYNTITHKDEDPLEPLGKWNEIPWIKTILDRNWIYGDVKFIRLRIYGLPGDEDPKIEISFQRSGEDKVETLLATNQTSNDKLVNYLPDCSIFNGQQYYIFRQDSQGRVILIWRYYEHSTNRNQAPIEKGPFYLHVSQRKDKSQIVSFHLNAPPSPYNPLFTKLPIYGWMPKGVIHLWDLPNHRVFHFEDPILEGKYEAELGAYEFEKYFDCQENEKPPKKDLPPKVSSSQEITKKPQVETEQSNTLMLYVVLILCGLIAVVVVLIVWTMVKRKWKRKKVKKPALSDDSSNI